MASAEEIEREIDRLNSEKQILEDACASERNQARRIKILNDIREKAHQISTLTTLARLKRDEENRNMREGLARLYRKNLLAELVRQHDRPKDQ